MTPKDYVDFCITRDFPNLDYAPVIHRLINEPTLIRMIHASIGMSGETGEILDNLKKSMVYGKALDINNLKEECGDVLWYMAIFLHSLGSSFEEVMTMNKEKLEKRYPTGFTEKDAMKRKDKQ